MRNFSASPNVSQLVSLSATLSSSPTKSRLSLSRTNASLSAWYSHFIDENLLRLEFQDQCQTSCAQQQQPVQQCQPVCQDQCQVRGLIIRFHRKMTSLNFSKLALHLADLSQCTTHTSSSHSRQLSQLITHTRTSRTATASSLRYENSSRKTINKSKFSNSSLNNASSSASQALHLELLRPSRSSSSPLSLSRLAASLNASLPAPTNASNNSHR